MARPKKKQIFGELTLNSNDKNGTILNGKNEAAVSLGRLGGLARTVALTPERRKEIARNAAKTRWGNQRKSGRKTK